MDASESPPENPRRGCIVRTGGSQKQKAPESGNSYPRRPLTRSRSKLGAKPVMCNEEAAQQKLISEGDVLQNDIEQKPNLKVDTLFESHCKKMMRGGKRPKRHSSVDTIKVELEENDIIRVIEIEDEVPSANGGHWDISPEISDAPKIVSKTVVNSGIQTSDLQTTERKSQANSSPSENDCPNKAGLTAMKSDTSLLQSIYNKYGDITKGCDFKSEEFKKSCLLDICGVVQKLRDTSFDDLNYDDFTELYSSIKDAENMKFDVTWLHERLVEIDKSLRSRDKLKTLEEDEIAITLQAEDLQKRLEMNNLKIAELENEIEILEEEQAAKISRHSELKAMTDDIKSSYQSFPKYVIDYLL